MSDATPTRSVVLEMKDERRAMHDGYVFLDEKCLLLAAEILRELQRYGALRRDFAATHSAATEALEAAIARHGLHGLQVYPAANISGARLRDTRRAVMGVRLQEVALDVGTVGSVARARPFAGSRSVPPRLRGVARRGRIACRRRRQSRAPVARIPAIGAARPSAAGRAAAGARPLGV